MHPRDPFDTLLDQAQRLATSGRAIQWRKTLQAALALERTEPPSLRRAEALLRHAAGVVPEGALVDTHLRAVTIARELGDDDTARRWTEHLVNTALAGGRPEVALGMVRELLATPPSQDADRRQLQGWERRLLRAAPRPEAPAPRTPAARPPSGAHSPEPRPVRASGPVARWAGRIRRRLSRAAREEGIDDDALVEALDHLRDLTVDLRRLGGDRGTALLDDLEAVEDPQRDLRVVAGETDLRQRVETLEDLGDDGRFWELRAALEPVRW